MRYAAGPLAFLLACQAAPEQTQAQAQASSWGDTADTSCQIVLRHAGITDEGRSGPQTDCSSGTCWAIVTVTFDLAMSQSLAETQAFVLYQGEKSSAWQQSGPAEPAPGCDAPPAGPCAPVGFRRYRVTLRTDTFTTGAGNTNVHLIPFLVAGGRLFDHNRIGNPLGSYLLTAQNNWTIADDAAACPGTTPASRLTATFATGWRDTSAGTLAPGGKLDVAYDLYRMPQYLGCTTDGVAAFATVGSVQFQPSGQVLSEVVNGPLDPTTGKYESLPLEFDVPVGTTSAALWFMSSSDCGGGPLWDSNYGRNYVFTR